MYRVTNPFRNMIIHWMYYSIYKYVSFRAEKRVVEFLLSKGASVVARTAAGDTALHLAASNGRHELCPLLAEQNGIDLFATNYEGKIMNLKKLLRSMVF